MTVYRCASRPCAWGVAIIRITRGVLAPPSIPMEEEESDDGVNCLIRNNNVNYDLIRSDDGDNCVSDDDE